jgi:hypothetical protein
MTQIYTTRSTFGWFASTAMDGMDMDIAIDLFILMISYLYKIS